MSKKEVYQDPGEAIDDAMENERAKSLDQIEKDAILYMALIQTPGFKKLEEVINGQITDLVNVMLNSDDDELVLKNRYLIRGKKNILDIVHSTISNYKLIKEDVKK